MKKITARLFQSLYISSMVFILAACSMDLQLDNYKSLLQNPSVPGGGNDLDLQLSPTFGTNNVVNTLIDPGLKGANETGVNSEFQSSGKIVSGGYRINSGVRDFVLARFNSDGSLDQTFGQDGVVVTDVQGNNSDDTMIQIKVIDNDAILAMGITLISSKENLVIIKYTANGAIDTSFGSSGRVILNVSGDYPVFKTLDVDPTTKTILVAGDRSLTWDSSTKDAMLIQFLANGSLDTNFATTGILIHDFQASGVDRFNSAIYLSDGRIAAVGEYRPTTNPSKYSMLRVIFSATGSIVAPVQETAVAGKDVYAQKVIQLSSGALVVAGETYISGLAPWVAQYSSSDFSADSSFGSGAMVAAPSSSAKKFKYLCAQSDGKILVVGQNSNNFPYLTRYLANGSVDTGFGTSGVLENDIADIEVVPGGCLIKPSGDILLSGQLGSTGQAMSLALNGSDIGVLQLNPNGSVSTSFGEQGVASAGTFIANDPLDFTVVQTVQQTDGKIIVLVKGDVIGSSPVKMRTGLLRYLADGQLDLDFGTAGYAPVTFRGDSDRVRPLKIVAQADGKLVVLGVGGLGAQLSRIHASGLLDISFGQNGYFEFGFLGDYEPDFGNMILDSHGKIVLAGVGYGYDNNGDELNAGIVVRLTAQGAYDSTFADQGVLVQANRGVSFISENADGSLSLLTSYFNFPEASQYMQQVSDEGVPAAEVLVLLEADVTVSTTSGMGAAFDPQGRLILAQTSNDNTVLSVKRYLATGVLDTSFATQGEVQKNIADADYISAMRTVVDKSGNIFVMNSEEASGSPRLAIHAFDSQGLVSSFFQGVSSVVNIDDISMGGMFGPTADLSRGLDKALYFSSVLPDGKITIRRYTPPN